MPGSSREVKDDAAHRDATAPSTPEQMSSPAHAMVQQRRPGAAGPAPVRAAVASGLVEPGVQLRRSGEGEPALGSAAVASGLVEPMVQLRRSGPGETSPGDTAVASGIVEQGHQVQRSGRGELAEADTHAAAARGVATPGGPLPHLAAIQMAFGHHDISGVQAHTGSEARASAQTMGADAYATGHHVVFGARSDLFTAAHEAAHVVQQRAGVQLKGGVGESGDVYERQADEVAGMVVRGESAEALLDQHGGGATRSAVERPIQRLSSTDYNNPTDRNNVRDGIVQAIRANPYGMDWTQYWNHIIQHNHNTPAPTGNSSTFGGDTQSNIIGYILQVLNTCTPYLSNDSLVFDSTGGGICNGLHQQGPRTNVRVVIVVANVEDEQFFSDQIDSIVVENAYPIR